MDKIELKLEKIKNLRESIEVLIEEVKNLKNPSEITVYTKNLFGLTKIQDKKGNLREEIKKSPNKDLLTKLRDTLKDGGHFISSNICIKDNNISGEYYYAIKKGIGVENKIVHTWYECKTYVDGYDSVYKKFESLDECEEYFKTVDVEQVIGQKKYIMEQKQKGRLHNKKIQIDIPNEMYNDLEKLCGKEGIELKDAIMVAINKYLY